jgi:hypothetical protein
MDRNIFLNFIYNYETINVTGTQYEKIFKKSNFDPKSIKFNEFLWCAVEIANSLSTSDGAKFLEDTVNIASYFANKKTEDKNLSKK